MGLTKLVEKEQKEIIYQQITEMLKKKIVKPSHYSWSSSVVLMKKKDEQTSFCAHYRKLYNVTKIINANTPN